MRTFIFAVCLVAGLGVAQAQHAASTPSWDPKAAAGYMDARQAWWMTWPNAARDHDTACVSCHTALPYALARSALRAPLAEHEASAPERRMLEQVTKRVRLWKEIEPFYPDQTRGLPKTSESRGTEAILNAVILATHDAAATGTLSDDTRQAFDNLWPLQFKAGDQMGAWAWLNFHYEPWEASGSPYFGASLAAIAVGTAPGHYRETPAIQDRLKLLREYLQRGADKEHLFNRAMVLWASSKLPDVLTPAQVQHIGDALVSKQQTDGGWTTASLGPWKRVDETELDTKSDGYATGLIVYALQQAGRSSADAAVARGRAWLVANQDRATGMWNASSLNKRRDPATDVGKFMSDAATGYAVLALTRP
jgi:squalene-hopene/tetraprenyl-beta-curcumene cyclase